MLVKLRIFPKYGWKFQKYLKPPPNIKMDGFGGTTILGSMLVYQRVILGDHPIPSGTITDSSPSAKVTSTEASVKSNRWMAVSSFSPSPTAWKDGNQCWVGASGESRRCEWYIWLISKAFGGKQLWFSSWWFFSKPLEKDARQNGSFPQVGVKIKNVSPSFFLWTIQ